MNEARFFLSAVAPHGAACLPVAQPRNRRLETAMSPRIDALRAMEILDSRGNPTLKVCIRLDNGVEASASVPSGASTGAHEAAELRDGDPRRYGGKGVLKAVANVNDVIGPALRGTDVTQQASIDAAMIELDGTPTKARLGANAILGVSQACARAAALARHVPLYASLGGATASRLPMPMFNVINGGKHADSGLDIQEFMIVPRGAPSFAEALRYASETFHALHGILRAQGYTVSVGDEGGFAPMLESNEEAFESILEAISAAGYRPGDDIALAIDAAATSFFHEGRYRLARSAYRDKTADELTMLYQQWIRKYPLMSVEDGLAEDDWAGFQAHTAALGRQVQIVGDDILVTNTRFIRRAIEEKACNAALIKLNQIGTVSETVAAVELCRKAGWGYVISHRSGETDDSFMADFAVAMDGGQIKAGSVCRGERIAKYNRLLEIEQELGERARFGH
jgi:enolase